VPRDRLLPCNTRPYYAPLYRELSASRRPRGYAEDDTIACTTAVAYVALGN
jgi:hypothetical protein